MEHTLFDLIVIGASSTGLAVAYQAVKDGKKVCILEKEAINQVTYVEQKPVSRMSKIIHNQSYMIQFVREAYKYWRELQQISGKTFVYRNGTLMFGSTQISTSQGSIKQIQRTLKKNSINHLYMKSLSSTQPAFFKNFQMNAKDLAIDFDRQKWQAIYTDDGGSIDMQTSYNFFLSWLKSNPGKCQIRDNIQVVFYKKKNGVLSFNTKNLGSDRIVEVKGSKAFIAVGTQTPEFLIKIMNADKEIKTECQISEFIVSYFQVQEKYREQYSKQNFPHFLHYVPQSYKAAFGFPIYEHDQPVPNTVQIGTFMNNPELTKNINRNSKINLKDIRIKETQNYIQWYMNGIKKQAVANYCCPVLFYQGRQTVLDYLIRKNKDVVVQNGGWTGHLFPYIAKTAYKMLFEPVSIFKSQNKSEGDIMRKFIDRTRYPIKKYLQRKLKQPENKLQFGDHFDTVVVGAGCSGLYSAYRLHNSMNRGKGPKPSMNTSKIGVFDMLDRIAGRLWTVEFKGSNTPMQLGGMRYIEQQHKLLANLIEELDMPKLNFNMSGNILQERSLKAFFREDHYRYNEWEQLQKKGGRLQTNYKLSNNLIGMTAYQIICYSIYSILMQDCNKDACAKIDPDFYTTKVEVQSNQFDWKNYKIKMTLQDWNIIKPLLKYKKTNYPKAEPEFLYKYGFQNIIQDQFGHQTYNFVSQQNGYFSNTSNASYMQQVCTYVLDFGNVTYKTLQGGFDMFCYNLVNSLLDDEDGIQKHKGGIYLQKQLKYIEKLQGKYKLVFDFLDTRGKSIQITADNIILGMPKRSIEILYERIDLLRKKIDYPTVESKINNKSEKPKQPKDLKQLIKSTQNMPAIKIIMNFRKNWWDIQHDSEMPEEYKIGSYMRGVSTTDLPIRQSLYFGTDTDNLLLASYNDMVTTEFWSALQENFPEWPKSLIQKWKPWERSRFYSKKKGTIAPASDQVVKQVLNQLRLLHCKKQQAQGLSEQNVKQAMFQNWGVDPFGGGYHNWMPGYDIDKVMKTMRRPWKKQNIFIVGEAFSNLTGWIQGALQTTQNMLHEHYNLPYTIEGYYTGY